MNAPIQTKQKLKKSMTLFENESKIALKANSIRNLLCRGHQVRTKKSFDQIFKIII